jgi:hypothetical protein
VLAIVAVLLVALVTSGSGSRTPDAGPAPATTVPTAPTFADGPARIIDRSAGISYPVLGGWLQYSQAGHAETTTVTGQYFTVQEPIPDGGQYVAQCTSGPVAAGYGWHGAATLQRTMTALVRSVREHEYPTPNRLQVLGDQARTVDGHPARLYEFDVAWHVPGYEATGERVALLLIDVGRPAPALLYVAIPDTHTRLYPDIDRVLGDVRVL